MRVLHAIAASTIALSVLIQPATAAKDPNEVAIGARQGYMKMVVFNAGPLFGMAKGKMDYNADMAKGLAANLQQLSNVNTGRMWLEGSDHDQYEESEALPEIWLSLEEFKQREQAFADAVAELAPVAGNGLDALRDKVNGLGEACQSCHDDFRVEQ